MRVPALPYLKRPKDAGFRTAAADSTRRAAKRRNAVTVFFRYLTLHAQAPARRVQEPETTHAGPFTHERFSGLGTFGLLPANPRGLGVSDLWPGKPASIGRLRAGRSVENRPLRQPSWRIKLPRARKIRRSKNGLGRKVTIFVTCLLEMVNDLPPKKACHAPKERFLSNKSHKMAKNASWHGL